MNESPPTLELVGGGLAEWPSGQGPRGETIAAAAFVDATGHDAILALPHAFHAVGAPAWSAVASFTTEPLALVVSPPGGSATQFAVALNPQRHRPLVEAMLRDGGVYLVPTSTSLGINARLARDHSFWVRLDAAAREVWRAEQARSRP